MAIKMTKGKGSKASDDRKLMEAARQERKRKRSKGKK